MQETLHIRATVQPGNRIEIVNGQLQEGEEVDVVVSPASSAERRSAVDILSEAEAGPGLRRSLCPERVGLPVDYSGPERGAVSMASSTSLPSVAVNVRRARSTAWFALTFPSTNIAPPWMGSGERNSLLSVAK